MYEKKICIQVRAKKKKKEIYSNKSELKLTMYLKPYTAFKIMD